MQLKPLLLAAISTYAAADIRFQSIEVPPHSYTGGWNYYVGGGIASFDCNGDHLPEIFAAGGASPAILMRNTSTIGGTVSFRADTPASLAIPDLIGAYPLDIDSDGYLDLVLLSTGRNQLMQGLGDCNFSPFKKLKLSEKERWSTSFSATWESDQRLPTLAIGNYVDRDNPKGPFGTCDINMLYRPDALSYVNATPLEPSFCTLSMLFSDWSRTAKPELRISNDRHYYVKGGAEQLWRMGDTPVLYTESDGWEKHELWGMGIASRDISGDGYPDVYLSSMGDQRLQLQSTPGKPEFTDAPFDWGTTAHRPHSGNDGRPSTGWHTAFGDINNDGLDDIFVAKGNVEQMPGSAIRDPNSLLLATAPQRWKEIANDAGITSFHRGRGASLVDFNQDGLLDLAVNNRRDLLQVWQNASENTGHWLSIELQQPQTNTRAVGAWIEVRTTTTQAREITVGGGHAGGHSVPEHFGIGEAEEARVRVIWPDGKTTKWTHYKTDQHITIIR